MKHISFMKCNLLVVLCALAMLSTSCINEELDACKNNKLIFKVENFRGDDITLQGLVQDASLYIFDENQNFVEERKLDFDFIMNRKEIELLNYPSNQKLYIVAWGNLGDQTKQSMTKAEKLEDLKLVLKSENGVTQGDPDSLYYGQKEVITLDGTVEKTDTIPVRIRIGTYTIKTIGLENAPKALKLKAGNNQFDFGMTNTLDAYDYQGKEAGEQVTYIPLSKEDNREGFEWITSGELVAVQPGAKLRGGKQNAFTADGLAVTIFQDGEVLKTVTEAEDEKTSEVVPINIRQGENRDIFIVFEKDGSISARIRVTPWGVVDDEIEF